MHIGYVGLGKMGINMVFHLLDQGIKVSAWNRSPEPRTIVANAGAVIVDEVTDLPAALSGSPRIIWLMLPAGNLIDEFIDTLLPLLTPGEVIIDGANSNYKDTKRRAEKFKGTGVHFMDVGVSGGPEGARNGACLMIGGEEEVYHQLTDLWTAIAAPEAFSYFGSHGAGHFVKMVHNGIEYGMMQAIAEGLAVLHQNDDYELDHTEVLRVYNNRSVIESRLVGWAKKAISEEADLANTTSLIGHTGEGRWTIDVAKELGLEVPVIEAAYQARLESTAESNSFRDKVVQALRIQFGGPRSSDN